MAATDPTTTTSSVPTNLTLAVEYDGWQPNPTPFDTLVNDPHLYRCTTGGSVRSAYTMDVSIAYTFDAADQLHSNQSVTAFELRGILYALGSGPDSHRFTDSTGRNALFDGVVHPSSLWEVDEQEQHCVRATWRFDVPPSLRGGTFEIVAAPPNMALFVQSASLIYLGDSTSQTDTSAGVSTSATVLPPAQPPSGASSSPNLGVIIPAILVPVLVILSAIIAFFSWRKRHGGPIPYEFDPDARSATSVRVNTKLRRLFGADVKEHMSPEYLVGDTSGGDDPLASSIGPDGATLVALKQIPRHTPALPTNSVISHLVVPQLIVGGPTVRQARSETDMRELGELRELHQAMHRAGFTVNTLFDRLRRNNSARRHGDTVADVSTVTSHSAVGEPLPRYE